MRKHVALIVLSRENELINAQPKKINSDGSYWYRR